MCFKKQTITKQTKKGSKHKKRKPNVPQQTKVPAALRITQIPWDGVFSASQTARGQNNTETLYNARLLANLQHIYCLCFSSTLVSPSCDIPFHKLQPL